MSTKAQGSFAFVPGDDFGRPKVADRKLIRSHCMIGKNKKKERIRTSKAVAGRACAPVRHDTSRDHPNDIQIPSRGRRRRSENKVDVQTATKQLKTEPIHSPLPPPIDLALVKFAHDIDDTSRELIYRFYSEAKNVIYPADLYVDFDYSKAIWFTWLYQDTAYLESALLTASALEDFLFRRPFSNRTYSHLRKTITYLNTRLSDSTLATRDSTVSVVLGLTQVADVLGDQTAVKAHVAGLQQIIRMRGGLDTFKYDVKLYMKLSRLDLAHSLSTGDSSNFLTHAPSWDPVFDTQPLTPESLCYSSPATTPPSMHIESLVDPRLATVFRDLQCFAAAVNATSPKNRIPAVAFQNIVGSIQHRLIRLHGTLDGFLDEYLRLGMLAFLMTTFQLPGNAVRYPFLARRFRDCCLAVETTPELRELARWLLVIGAMSVCSLDEPWLRERWRVDVPEGPGEWSQARARLRDVMWMNALHDEHGRLVFEAMISSEKRAEAIPSETLSSV